MRILYIHGFGSSPASRKAQFFAGKLAGEGQQLLVPELAPDFGRLTISGQLAVMREAVGEEEAVLIGSSLGGYLSAIFAAAHPNVQRLLLLAPAFRFADLFAMRVGAEGMRNWEERGSLDVYSYADGREVPLSSQLMIDAQRYPAEPDFPQPALLIHGSEDDTVPVTYSERYVAERPNCRLVRFEAGHELTDALEPIWEVSRPFLLSTESHI